MIVSIFTSVAIAYLTRSMKIGHLLLGDSLYLPGLFRDILLENGSFFDWHFPGAPYFFPDMGLFFLIQAFVKNTYFSTLIYSLLQIGITYLVMLLLINILSPVIAKTESHEHKNTLISNRRDIALLIFLCIVIFVTINTGATAVSNSRIHQPYYRILSSVFHFGNLINTLILIAAIIAIFEAKNVVTSYIIIFLISVLGTSSDALFVVSAAVPSIISVIISSIVCKSKRQVIFKIICILLLGVIVGGLAAYSTFNTASADYLLRQNNLIEQLKILGSIIFITSFKDIPIIMFFVFGFYGIIIKRIINFIKSEKREASHLYTYLFIILSIISTLLAVVFNGILGSGHYAMTRYFLNLYWFPVLFSWLIADVLPYSQSWRFKPIRNVVFSVALIFSAYQSVPKQGFVGEYYPPLVQCVDKALDHYEEATGLTVENGISSYGPSKALSEYSKHRLNVIQVRHDLAQHTWVSNPTRYLPKYDFAILAPPLEVAPDPAVLHKLNGAPEHEYSCTQANGPVQVLIYGKDGLRVEKFPEVGDSYTWQGCELPIRDGVRIQDDCSAQTPTGSFTGVVTFGPYEPLPKGRYQFSVRYASSSAPVEKVGGWDILIHLPEKTEQLQHGGMRGTASQYAQIDGLFTIDENSADSDIEFRTTANGSGVLKVAGISFTRIE